MRWEPWDLYKVELEEIKEITEPPCKRCRHWKPQPIFKSSEFGLKFDGIVCCHSNEQEHDFSCYAEKINKQSKEVV